MAEACWVCQGSRIRDGKIKGARGACSPCLTRLRKKYGDRWCDAAKEAIEDGRRHELMPQFKGQSALSYDSIPPHWLTPVPYCPPKPLTRPQMEKAQAEALRQARADYRRIVSIPIGDPLLGRSMFFEPYLDREGVLQVREMRGA